MKQRRSFEHLTCVNIKSSKQIFPSKVIASRTGIIVALCS